MSPTLYREIRHAHGLGSRHERLRRRGLLTPEEMAASLGVHPQTVTTSLVGWYPTVTRSLVGWYQWA